MNLSKFVVFAAIIALMVIVGFPGAVHGKLTISDKEKDAIQKLRQMVNFSNQQSNYVSSDEYLIYWVRSSFSSFLNVTYLPFGFSYRRVEGFDLESAAKKLEANLAWRKEQNIEHILEEDLSDLKRDYPYEAGKFDKFGRPIFAFAYKPWDFRRAFEEGDIPRFQRYIFYIIEQFLTKVRQLQSTGVDVWQVLLFFNVDEYNEMQHNCLACKMFEPFWTNVLETHYPLLTTIYVHVNAENDFQETLTRISKNVRPETQKGLRVYDHNKTAWLEELSDLISKDQIPFNLAQEEVTTTTTTPAPPTIPSFFTWNRLCGGCVPFHNNL